jgi:hypothetical protein
MPIDTYLTKLKTVKNMRKSICWGTFDTETKDGLKGSEIFCASVTLPSLKRDGKVIKDSHRILTTYDGDFEEVIRYIIEDTFLDLIFVQNLDFEGRMLLDYALRNGIQYFQIDAGKLLEFHLIIPNNRTVVFRDSWQFLQSSQEDAEKAWKVPDELRKIDCSDLFELNYSKWSNDDKERVREHNRNDTKALYDIMKKFRLISFDTVHLDIFNSITPASYAMRVFRTTLINPVINPFLKFDTKSKSNYSVNEEIENFIRASYFGGRVEAFANPVTWDEIVAYIDVNSLYPSVMYKNRFPVGKFIKLNNLTEKGFKYVLNRFEGFAKLRVNVPKIKVQPLPYQSDGKLIFPYGTFTGTWAFPEIRNALDYGVEINEYIECYYTTESIELFKPYIDMLYPLKQNAGDNKGLRNFIKLLLNSLYGKFGQKHTRISSHLREIDPETEETLKKIQTYNGRFYIEEEEESNAYKPFMLVHIAAYVTSYARVLEYSYLSKAEILYYCDTDSLVVPIANIDKYILNDELGSVKIEWQGKFVCFAPKVYYFDGVDEKGKPIVGLKAKGVSKLCPMLKVMFKALEYVEDPRKILEKCLHEGFEVTKYTRWKEGMHKGKVLGFKTVKRQQNLLNSKRVEWNGYSSQPICIME